MIKVPVDMIIKRIEEETELSEEEVKSKINEKLKQLSGLISEEGAAHIVANQLGVKVLEQSGELKIKNILPGMRDVNIAAKIIRIYPVREFEKENRKGKVGSFLIGDKTGIIRVVCWNDKTEVIDKLEENQIIKIESGYARENRNGKKEIHISNKGKIILDPDDVKDVDVETETQRKKIIDLEEGDRNVEVLGTIVQIYDPRFFEVCPECNRRAREKEDGYYCDTHEQVEPKYSYVLNLIMDDGSENIRVVLWRQQVEKIFDMPNEELLEKRGDSFSEIKNELLGKIVLFEGRTSKNDMFDRLEFIANFVNPDPDPEKEVKRLSKKVDEKEEQEEEESLEETDEEKIEIATEEDEEEEEELTEEELLSLEDLED